MCYVLTGSRGTQSDLKPAKALFENQEIALKTNACADTRTESGSRTKSPTYESELGLDEQRWLSWFRKIDPEDRTLVEPIVKGFADRAEEKKVQAD